MFNFHISPKILKSTNIIKYENFFFWIYIHKVDCFRKNSRLDLSMFTCLDFTCANSKT